MPWSTISSRSMAARSWVRAWDSISEISSRKRASRSSRAIIASFPIARPTLCRMGWSVPTTSSNQSIRALSLS